MPTFLGLKLAVKICYVFQMKSVQGSHQNPKYGHANIFRFSCTHCVSFPFLPKHPCNYSCESLEGVALLRRPIKEAHKGSAALLQMSIKRTLQGSCQISLALVPALRMPSSACCLHCPSPQAGLCPTATRAIANKPCCHKSRSNDGVKM